MKQKSPKKLLAQAVALGCLVTSGYSHAQLEEVVVTATKRAESIQDIPMSVAVLSEDALAKMGALEFFDYATSVPNLSFGHFADGTFTSNGVQIRGIAGIGTTGFYIDEIPIPESMNPRVIDTERIEVLRGPQGSLYGARNMGGTVRLITKHADPEQMEAKTRLYGTTVSEGDQDWGVDFALNVPMTDTAAFRLSGYWQEETGVRDMIVDNPFDPTDTPTSRDNVDDARWRGFQALVTWNVNDRFVVEPRYMYQKANRDWMPFSDFEPDNFTINRIVGLPEKSQEEFFVASVTMTYETDYGTFTSASAFLDRETTEREDMSEISNFLGLIFGVPDYFPVGGTIIEANNDREQITQEFRFTSDFDGRYQVVAGAFYSEIETDTFWPCSVGVGLGNIWGAVLGPALFGQDCIFTTDGTTNVDEMALYGEVEFEITDKFSITAGGRWFDNEFDTSSVRAGLVVLGTLDPDPFSGNQSESGFNPKVAAEYHVNDDWSLYGTAAKGFRIGGANSIVPVIQCGDDLAELGISGAPDSFDSDELWNYEIGTKSTHMDGKLSISAAAFFIDWTDIQQITRLACGFQFLNNTGEAESKGFEVEINGRPNENWSYTLGMGYTDAEITDPQDAAGVFAGDPLPQVPELTFTANTEYNFEMFGHESYAFLAYSWIDESVSVNQGLANPRVRDDYDLLDARIGMYIGKWNISLFGKNLTNSHANLSDNRSLAEEDPRRPRIVTNRPRSIGIEATWEY